MAMQNNKLTLSILHTEYYIANNQAKHIRSMINDTFINDTLQGEFLHRQYGASTKVA